MEKSTKATMNPALRDFWRTRSRFKVLYGGRASSKSWDAAAHAIRLAQFTRIRVLCARQFQNKIEESVYSLLKIQIERFGLSDRFEILKNKIRCTTTGSEFIFYGIARNIAEIKGLEGVDVLWLEEAEAVSKEDYGILEATMRKEGSEIWVIFNPRNQDDFIYQHFVVNPPPNALVRQINLDENPFLSTTAREDAEALLKADPDEYRFRYLGVPRSNDERVLIKRTWLEAAIDAHIKLGITPQGRKRIGFDVADDGADLNAAVVQHGVLTVSCDEWKGGEDELLKSATRVWNLAREHGATIDYDCIGVGASMGAKFQELNLGVPTQHRVTYKKFNAGGKVIQPDSLYMPGVANKDHFLNLKAQAWWGVADRFRKTYAWVVNQEECDPSEIISLSSGMQGLQSLISELSTPRKDFSPDGRVKVESKIDLAKRKVKSPNKADAFVMANSPTAPGGFNWGAV